jgi:prepilin-type processing-associated H-X9-DG protein
MSGLLRLVVVAALAVWAWRRLLRRRRPSERATVAFADGSAFVLEPGSGEFERLAAPARAALQG